jgi:integrase
VDCRTCGAEDELYSGGQCWTCVLAATVDRVLTDPNTGVMTDALVPIALALKSMKRANSGLTWLRQPHVTTFLEQLALEAAITHASINALPNSRTREYVRGLLVEHGALPRQDDLAAHFATWAGTALTRCNNPANRDLIRRYIRWHHQRRMNNMPVVTHGTFLRAKQNVTVAIDFTNWLHDHGIALDELNQGHLDAWQASGPSTREHASSLLRWAQRIRLVDSRLRLTGHRRGNSHILSSSEQRTAVERTVNQPTLPARDRLVAILVLVFGQQIESVVRLTWDHVDVGDELVTIRLGDTEIALPAPLDDPLRELAADRGRHRTAAHPNTNWVFRGYKPGRYVNPGHLRARLRREFSVRAARLGTLHELTRLAPIPIIAETLGYSPSTIERHAVASATTYGQYIAAARNNRSD